MLKRNGKDSPKPSVDGYFSAATRRDEGKRLRDRAPREAHASWTAPKKRANPIQVLVASNEERLPELIPIRFGRMLQSPFAFYRGSAAIMAGDLANTPKSGLIVQACGDAHLMNFGGFATPERQQIFDINDLDETLPAPWEWDLKRLATSIVIAGRHIGIRESEAASAARATVKSYRENMANYSSMRALEVWYDRIDIARLLQRTPSEKVRKRVEKRFEEAKSRSVPDDDFPKLVEHRGERPRIKDNPPLIFHPTKHSEEEYRGRIEDALVLYRDSLPMHVKALFDRFHFFDMAVKVVGIGSVGTVCLIGLFMAADDDPLFLQFKQARRSVLEPYAGASRYKTHGERVVKGQRLMQSASDIFLGWTTNQKTGHDFYVRQLRDMKLSAVVESFDAETLSAYGEVCAWALARAHARSGDAARIAGYMGTSQAFDDAVSEFAVEYADQNEHDYSAFVKAVRRGEIQVTTDA